MPKAGRNVYKRKDGRWEAQYYLGTDPVTGKRKKITKYGKTAKEAEDKLVEVINKVQSGTYIEKHKITIGSWFTQWLDVYAKPKDKQSTYVNYRTSINKRIIPKLGHVKLTDLRVDVLQRFFNEQGESGSLKKGGGALSPKTLRNLYILMNTALKQAYENTLISKNYAELVKLPKIVGKEMRVLSIEEHGKLFEMIKIIDERYKIGVLICLATGIRLGELAGLKWEDIDEKEMILRIRRTLNRLPSMDTSKNKTEIVIGTPKSSKSVRDIPIPDFLIDYIQNYKKEREKEKTIAGEIYSLDDFIICNELGNSIEPRTMQDTFKRIIKEAGIEDANFHCLILISDKKDTKGRKSGKIVQGDKNAKKTSN